MKLAEGIHPAGLHDFIQPGALDGQKTGDILVGFGMGEVDRFMRRVVVSGDQDHFAALSVFLHNLQAAVIKIKFVLQAAIIHFTVGKVNVEQKKLLIFGDNDPALAIKALSIESIAD